MKELEFANKKLQEKIANRQLLAIKPLKEEDVLAYLKSFKELDYSLENAKQRLIDLFVNRVILYDDHCEIYFNISNDKGKQLKLTEQPNIENEIEFDNKKTIQTQEFRIVITWRDRSKHFRHKQI